MSGSSQKQIQRTDVHNIAQSQNTAPAFGRLDKSPTILNSAGSLSIGGRDIKLTSVDPGALDAVLAAADVTTAALATVERLSVKSVDALAASARDQSKDLKDFADSAVQPDKEFLSDTTRNYLIAAVLVFGIYKFA